MKLKERLKINQTVKKELKPDFPKNMLIELTNVCNHSCVFCANSKMSRKKGFIDEGLAIRILKEAFENGTREVGFYATGEPFISNNLAKYIGIAKEIGYTYIYITTNGALATPDRAMEVIKAGIDSIKFSINAGSRKTYEMIHGKDEFEIVLDNLKYIHNYRKSNGLDFKLYVSYIVTKYTDSEKNDFKEMIKDYIDDIVFLNVANQGGMMDEINTLLRLDDDEYNLRSLPCPMIFNSLHVTYEGYLSACCIDFQNYLTVADLKNTSLCEAWHGDSFVKLRERHLKNDLEGMLCNNCIYNKSENIKPLIEEHATAYNVSNFRKDKEIEERLNELIK